MKTSYQLFCKKNAVCVIAFVLSALGMRADVVITTLHSFKTAAGGAQPNALVLGRDGNLYGTTAGGGTGGHGTVFRFTTNGVLTTLYSFNGTDTGSVPYASPVQGSDGNLYGTTSHGGVFNAGTAYKLTPDGVFTSFHSFYHGDTDHGIDGLFPTEVTQGSDGNLYGMTPHGGWGDNGVVFRFSTSGVFANIHYFLGGSSDALFPNGPLVQGTDGDYYGMAPYGGANFGLLFKINTSGVVTIVYNFTGGNDGRRPSRLLLGTDGNYYGTTVYGGTNNFGTVFKFTTNGVCTGLYSFSNGNDGAYPGALVEGVDGSFYGTSVFGTNGLIFRVSADGAFTNLYTFTGGNDGANAQGLVLGRDGNLYGTTWYGGQAGNGTIFKITTDGTFTTMYSFPGAANDGASPSPRAGLVQANDGYFYGSTSAGGANNNGTIFRIGPDGAFTSLYSFTGGIGGTNPQAALVQGDDGWLYGTTTGGTNDYGTIFKISTNGVFASLYSFTGGSDSLSPQAPLVKGNDGNFYGTTYGGLGSFSNTFGTVFKINTNGQFTTLYAFTVGTNGASPKAGLLLGSDGIFYGTTYSGGNGWGTIFSITADGVFSRLYSFTNDYYNLDGAYPSAALVQGTDGNLYGTSYGSGGENGTAFKLTTHGELTALYRSFFTQRPLTRLLQAADGNFYGTTYGWGGNYDTGRIFKIATNGILTTVQSFRNNDGIGLSELVQSSDGSFYCTSQSGGAGYGAVLRINIGPVFKAATVTNGTLTLTWSTDVGSTYQLQYKSEVNSANWVDLGSPILATGSTLSATDSVANDPQRFYRVAVLPQ